MALLTILGVLFVIVGVGLIALSARYFMLGIDEFYQNKYFKKSNFKRY